MKTKLTEIKTAAELITFIRCFGRSTKQEDIVIMQDIIGHTAADELAEIANDANAGSTFYHMLFAIWNYEDAVRFYNTHTAHLPKQLDEALEDFRSLEAEYKELDTYYNQMTERYKAVSAMLKTQEAKTKEAEAKAAAAEAKTAKLEAEIMQLKAKLYDMMTAAN